MPDRAETLKLRVVPNAKRSECIGIIPGTGEIKIKLAAPAVDGKANKALVEFLAKTIGVPKNAIEIVRGEKNRNKTVALSAIGADAAHRRLLDAAKA